MSETGLAAGSYAVSLSSADGTELSAVHVPHRDRSLAVIAVHGFSGSWAQPDMRRVIGCLSDVAGVIGLDLRGHGDSDGASTLGYREVMDVDVAVRWARELGYARVATLGFSMGASVVVRHAALHRGVDAVVAVSGPAFWYYRGTRIMRRLHRAVGHPLGRWGIERFMSTRVDHREWPDPPPVSPEEAAAQIAPTPLLVVHGDRDRFFPVEHAMALHRAAPEGFSDLWVLDGFGHAEAAISDDVVGAIGEWIKDRVTT